MPEPDDRHPSTAPPANGRDLNESQLRVLRLLEDEGPLQAVEISSLTRLPLDALLPTLRSLVERGLLERQDPEPAHDRFSIHLEGLEKELA